MNPKCVLKDGRLLVGEPEPLPGTFVAVLLVAGASPLRAVRPVIALPVVAGDDAGDDAPWGNAAGHLLRRRCRRRLTVHVDAFANGPRRRPSPLCAGATGLSKALLQ